MLPWDLTNCSFGTVDSNPNRTVSFVTHVEVTGDDTAALPEDAMKRLLSMLIVSRLDSKALSEACESLVDAFKWSVQAQVASSHEIVKHVVALRPTIRTIESKPFVFEDE